MGKNKLRKITIDYNKTKEFEGEILYHSNDNEGNEFILIKIPKEERKLYPSFWYMTDLHTFIRPKGKNIIEIKESMKEIAQEYPYGMVCSVTILDKDGNEIREVGENCHIDKNGNGDINRWYRQIIKDDVVRNYKKEDTE